MAVKTKLKPGDGTMVDDNIEFQSSSEEYRGIVKHVTPAQFYMFSGLTNDKFENDESTIAISIMHESLFSRLRSDLFKMKRSDMIRATVSIGIIAHAKHQNIMGKTIKPLIQREKREREIYMSKRFQKSLDRLEPKKIISREALTEAVSRHGKNKWGDAIWKKMHNSWEMPALVFEDSEIIVSGVLLKQCRQMVKDPLTASMYKLSEKRGSKDVDAQNVRLCVTISNRFLIIAREYMRMFLQDKLKGQAFRGFFVTGLYILAKWVVADKMCKGEYDFGKLIDAVDKAASEY